MRPRQLCRPLQVAFLSCLPLPRREGPWVLLPTPSSTRSRAQPGLLNWDELGSAGSQGRAEPFLEMPSCSLLGQTLELT